MHAHADPFLKQMNTCWIFTVHNRLRICGSGPFFPATWLLMPRERVGKGSLRAWGVQCKYKKWSTRLREMEPRDIWYQCYTALTKTLEGYPSLNYSWFIVQTWEKMDDDDACKLLTFTPCFRNSAFFLLISFKEPLIDILEASPVIRAP